MPAIGSVVPSSLTVIFMFRTLILDCRKLRRLLVT